MASGSMAAIVDAAASDDVVMTQEALAEVLNYNLQPTTLAAMYVDLGDEADGARWLRGAVWAAITKDRTEAEAKTFVSDWT